MPKPPKNSTFTVIKVRLGRRSRELWSLGQLLLVVVIVIATVGAAQVVLCRSAHPGRALAQCLRTLP